MSIRKLASRDLAYPTVAAGSARAVGVGWSLTAGTILHNTKVPEDKTDTCLAPTATDYVASAAKAALGAVPFAGRSLKKLPVRLFRISELTE